MCSLTLLSAHRNLWYLMNPEYLLCLTHIPVANDMFCVGFYSLHTLNALNLSYAQTPEVKLQYPCSAQPYIMHSSLTTRSSLLFAHAGEVWVWQLGYTVCIHAVQTAPRTVDV